MYIALFFIEALFYKANEGLSLDKLFTEPRIIIHIIEVLFKIENIIGRPTQRKASFRFMYNSTLNS